ncbi:MAG: phosphatidylserine decarboxylase [Clostridiales bacterium]|nr:phosphatidylserine decarboxylase [Clostridiales bacterium]
MKIYDRRTDTYEEIFQYGAGKLAFLYNNPLGRLLLGIAVSPFVSNVYAWKNSRKSSAKKIPGFIKEHNIDMSDYEDREYKSFTDFFTRKIRYGKRPVDMAPEALISPADSKLLVYEIEKDTTLRIKGRTYTADEILADSENAGEFAGGYALVFRLTVDDYHRFCYPDRGCLISRRLIKGKLHTVSPVSKDHKIYMENTRSVNLLKTENFGTVAYIEVGAMLIGRIVDNGTDVFEKGQEKGYFEPGGSTVVILVKNVEIDKDIMEQSASGIETKVRYGERIGRAL